VISKARRLFNIIIRRGGSKERGIWEGDPGEEGPNMLREGKKNRP